MRNLKQERGWMKDGYWGSWDRWRRTTTVSGFRNIRKSTRLSGQGLYEVQQVLWLTTTYIIYSVWRNRKKTRTISNYLHNSPIKRHTSGWQEESLLLRGRRELSSSICQHCVGRLSKRGSAAWSESHSLLCDDGDDGDGANDYQTYSLF